MKEVDIKLNLKTMSKIIKLTIPNTLTWFIMRTQNFFTLYFAGKYEDPAILSGIGLSFVLIQCLLVFTNLGLAGAMKTLCSQAYGQKDAKLCRQVFTTALIVQHLLYFPLTFLLYFTEDIFRLFGIDHQSSFYAGQFCRYMMISNYFRTLTDIFRIYLQSVQKPFISLWSVCIGMIFFVPCSKYAYSINAGIFGLACCELVLSFVTFTIMFIFSRISPDIKIFFQDLCLHDRISFQQYLHLGLPSVLMTWFDSWLFYICVFASNYFGVIGNASQTILMNISQYLFSIGGSFGTTVTSLIGAEVGKGKSKKAKMILIQSVILITTLNVILFFAIFFNPTGLLGLYINDEAVINSSIQAVRVILIGNFFDSTQFVLQGALIGIGVQGKAVLGNSINYIVGLPIAFTLAFTFHMEQTGLWIGIEVSQALICFYFVHLLRTCSWVPVLETEKDELLEPILSKEKSLKH